MNDIKILVLTNEIKKTVIKSHLKLLDDVIKIAKNGSPSCNWIIKDIQKLKEDVRRLE